MPGRLFLTRPLGEASAALGIAPPNAETVPRTDIAPGQSLWVYTADGFREMRWGLIPQGRTNARGRPVMDTLVNARSETVFEKSAFDGTRRGALPVDGWYEWTGKAGRKTPWALSALDGALLWFACIWDVWHAPDGSEVAQFATVTCPPNEDVAPIHDRMAVILAPSDVPVWVGEDKPSAAALMMPLPAGRLSIRKAGPELLSTA